MDIRKLNESINKFLKEEQINELSPTTINNYIKGRQKQADDLSAKFEGINEANDNILNSMQEQIDLERQIRDNTKTEDDIAKKKLVLHIYVVTHPARMQQRL